MSLPARVRIVEVGPRDGLQNEARLVSVADRIGLIRDLAAAGLTTIEAGSFVSAKWVPQLADTDLVLAGLERQPGLRFPVLVPNLQGLDAALAAEVDEIAVFAAASEAFSQKNINCSIAESLDRFQPVIERARAAGCVVRGYVSCVLGCPYQGEVPIPAVVRVAEALVGMGCAEISLGDTIGIGTPLQARAMTASVAERIGIERVAVHFHDTYGQALANVFACLELGVGVVDASIAGLGGCPYAKGASGNLATEDLVYMLRGMGFETGVDLQRLTQAAMRICHLLGRTSNARASAIFR